MKSVSTKPRGNKNRRVTWQKFRWFSGGFLFLVVGVVIWVASKSQISDFDLILSASLVVLALPITLFNRKLEKQFKTETTRESVSDK